MFRQIVLPTLLLFLAACSKPTATRMVRIGCLAGPDALVVQQAQKLAARQYHFQFEIKTYPDYQDLNRDLAHKKLDANIFHHLDFLKDYQKQHGKQGLIPIGETFIYPLGAYSHHHMRVNNLPKGATIAVPKDPSNFHRALQLLASHGLLTLHPHSETLGVHAIANNPHQLKFLPVEADKLTSTLNALDLAIINTHYAIQGGLSPERALLVEHLQHRYVNWIVIREQDQHQPWVQILKDIFHSTEMQAAATQIFGGAVIPPDATTTHQPHSLPSQLPTTLSSSPD